MPPEIKIDPRRDFVRRTLPWLLAVAMLVVYALTLNSWVSLFNLNTVARVSGWIWLPDFGGPLFHIVTLPFRVLPVGAIPMALNLFSAFCAALTLGLLARSVGLLPHDRTEAQVIRERNDFALLTLRSAWLPTVAAVLLCGLQLTFWESATNGGPQMFDLLLFAIVVWSLLEYRLDNREWRLYLSAAIVGAGVVETAPMTGFFPVFVAAIIWSRGLNFFNLRFLGRMTFWGLAGFSIFLLPPVVAFISDRTSAPFLPGVKLALEEPILAVKWFYACATDPSRHLEDMIMPLFIALMPLFILSIRWKIGDSSRVGSLLANLMFHTIHAIFLCVCVWLMFDPPFSPREKELGLTLYYLIALSAAYYAGYFLLIFGRKHPRAGEFQPVSLVLLNRTVIAGVWALSILAIAGLFYKNVPIVRAINDHSLARYSSLVVEKLPRAGAIVLSDDPTRTFLTEAALTRDGRAKDFLLLDTAYLVFPQYHRYLHREWPEKWPLLVSPTNTSLLNPIGMIGMLAMLNNSNELYYLHPSFGYYFEKFYAEPHGLVYKLKLLPNDTLLPPAPSEDLMAENEAFWMEAQTQLLSSVEGALAVTTPDATEPLAQQLLARLHIPNEQSANAAVIGAYCSRSLDFWGVELERANHLTNAADAFETAVALNPDNVVAQINLACNEDVRAGQPPGADWSSTNLDRLGKFNNVNDAIAIDGPFDDPSFCYKYGETLVNDNGFFRQAVAPLERVRQLDPYFFPARSLLARAYGMNHLPDRMLEVLNDPMKRPGDYSDLSDSAELQVMDAAAYFQKNDVARGSQLLEAEVSRDPGNDRLVNTVKQVYISRGMYSNALDVVERRLSLSPDDPYWLFTKGGIEIELKKYDDAIATLNRVLAARKDASGALFQRARAYYLSGNLDAARTDYETLQQSQTNSFLYYYALGEIAWRQHNTNEAIRNYEGYLRSAPTNTAEARTVTNRLEQLEQASGGK